MTTLRVLLFCILTLLPALFTSGQTREPIVLYVSPDGRDTNSGVKTHPLATPEGARTRARQVRGQHIGIPLDIVFAPGTYALETSFVLTAQDGGDSLRNVTYRAAKTGTVHLSGGTLISKYRPVSDPSILKKVDPACKGNLLECDLTAEGIRETGSLRARGFGRPIAPSPLELFINAEPMRLARWPNSEWALVADTLAGSRDSVFVYAGSRPSRWTDETDIWLHGYWTYDWADTYTRVSAIDTARRLMTTTAPHGYAGYTPRKRYAALNILAELDEPGEYYIDRTRNILYFWPPDQRNLREVTVSLLESPLIVLDHTSGVTFAGFILECSRGAGVEIVGGHHNTIAGCEIRNIGSVGISIGRLEPMLGSRIYDSTLYSGDAGHHNGVQSCTIRQCGEGGVILCGGDRSTLEPGHNYVDNCHITDCCRWSKTYRAAVYMWGVGNRLSHSVMHNLPHTAAFFWGNDHILEYNEIYDVCRETGDAGAFYQGRDWSQRGNVIRHNYFHDVRGVQGQEGFIDVMSVYMDDFACQTTVSGNIFVNGGRTVMIGGGRDIVLENNLIIDGHPAVHVDARAKRDWAATMFDGPNSVLLTRLQAVRHAEPPYSSRYPRLATILKDSFAVPEGNVIRHNIFYGGIWRELQDGVTDSLVLFEGNVVDTDPGFVSARDRDFRLRPDAPIFRSGFRRLETEKIGLYKDAYRADVPVRTKAIPGSVASETSRQFPD